MARFFWVCVCCALVALTFSACGGRDQAGPDRLTIGGKSDGVKPGEAALPEPSKIPVAPNSRRNVNIDDGLLMKTGASFDPALPFRNVGINGDNLSFSPATVAAEPEFANVALAVYRFTDLATFDRGAMARSSWSSAPEDPGSIWLGLANFESNRWDWFKSPANFKVKLPSMTPYIRPADGVLLLAVLRTGVDVSTLSSVQLGGPLPAAVLTASKTSGEPPMSITLDASGSAAFEGTLVKYEFDKGDGVFIDNGPDPTLDVEYAEQGFFTAKLRITDSQGSQASAEQVIRVVPAWAHTYRRGGSDYIGDIAIAPNGDIYACGSSLVGNDDKAVVWHYSAFGELLGVRSPSVPSVAIGFSRCALDSEGNLILVGGYFPVAPRVGFIMKMSAGAENVIWAKQVGSGGISTITDVVTFGTDVFATGERTNSPNGSGDVMAMRINGAGDVVWQRDWNLGMSSYSEGDCAAMRSNGIDLNLEFLVGGITNPSDPDTAQEALVLGWDQDGELIRSWGLNVQSDFSATACIVPSGFFLNERLNVLGTYQTGDGTAAFIIKANLSGENTGGVSWHVPGAYTTIADMVFSPLGQGMLACGDLYVPSSGNPAVLLGLDADSGSGAAPQSFWDGAQFSALKRSYNGVVLAGTAYAQDALGEPQEFEADNTSAFTVSFFNLGGNSIDVGTGQLTAMTVLGVDSLVDGIEDGEIDGNGSALIRYLPLSP